MGWTSFRPEPGQTTDEIMRAEVDSDRHEIVASATARDAWYAALRERSGEVWAMVVLVRRSRNEFCYKDMTETMGPNACDAPAKVLDALTPTENANALTWRAKCRERLARPKPKRGDRIRFPGQLRFSDGTQTDTLTLVERNTFTDAAGRRYNLPGWRDHAYTIAN